MTKDMTFQSVLPAGEEKLRQLDPPPSKDLVDSLMEDVQCFASAWSLVGGRFDRGNMLEDAEHQKAELRDRLTKVLATHEPESAPHSADRLTRFTEWLVKEMPAGTVIGDPVWWARKLLAAACVFADEMPTPPSSALQSAIDLIADDSYAITFQSMAQYRTAVLGILRGKQPAHPPAVDDAQRSALVYVLRDLKAGIAEHATDVVWYSAIQTACDRIEEIVAALPAPSAARYCPFNHKPCEPIDLADETSETKGEG